MINKGLFNIKHYLINVIRPKNMHIVEMNEIVVLMNETLLLMLTLFISLLFTLFYTFVYSFIYTYGYSFVYSFDTILFTIVYKVHQLFLANFLSLTSVSTKCYIALHCMYNSTYHFSVSQYKDPNLHQGINLNAATSFLQHKCLNLISVLLIFL